MKRKYKQISLIIIVVILSSITAWLIFKPGKVDGEDFLRNVRDKNKKAFEDINKNIQRENELIAQLEVSISKNDSITAFSLIDTLIAWNKIHASYIYKGMIYEKQNKYQLSFAEYNKAIYSDPYSIGLEKRANLYMKTSQLELALTDYKRLNEWNNFYSDHIGKIYEIKKNKDSALKYYKIYLTRYPNNQIVIQKIKTLQK